MQGKLTVADKVQSLNQRPISKHLVSEIDYGICTNIGQRKQNQDAILAAASGYSAVKKLIFAVADGMSGHAGGSIASSFVCDCLKRYYEKMIRTTVKHTRADVSRSLIDEFFRIDRYLRYMSLKDSILDDMGTTLTSLYINSTHSIIAHVGDSRIYRLRKGRLSCLTVDHTFVQDLITDRELDPVQAGSHPLRNMLTNIMGTGEPLNFVETRIDRLRIEDSFLLCTDGLYKIVDEKDIIRILSHKTDASYNASAMVEQALKNSASDNISAIVVKLK